jgi:spore coat protein U-like protein
MNTNVRRITLLKKPNRGNEMGKPIKYTIFSLAIGFLSVGLAPMPVLAATSNGSFAVSVTVQAGCRVSPTTTASGIYPTAGAISTSAVSVACTISTPYNVSYSAGRTTGVTGIVAAHASALLDHSKLPESAYTTKWRRMAGTDTRTGTAGAGLVAPGEDADTITATVTY